MAIRPRSAYLFRSRKSTTRLEHKPMTTSSGTAWTLTRGDEIARVELHQLYKGRQQGGIGPSRETPNVFIFSDPATGEQHGYIDASRDDGCFHYTGEGQRGDQRMSSGNAAILNHKQDGRALRLFMGARGVVRYEGEFEIDDGPAVLHRRCPRDRWRADPQGDRLSAPPDGRTGRLPAPRGSTRVAADTGVEHVPIEEQLDRACVIVAPSQEPYEAERREQKLRSRAAGPPGT